MSGAPAVRAARGRERARAAKCCASGSRCLPRSRRISRQALAYDLDRHTPFKPEELYFDAAVVDRNPARNTVTVDLAAVAPHGDRSGAQARRRLGRRGLRDRAGPAADAPISRGSTLLPPELRTSRPLVLRWQFWVPVVLLAAMTVAAIAIPLWQKREYVLQLATQADQARSRAAVSETLRAELNARVADYNFALERKYAFPGSLQVVDTVSKLLPDDTWLTQFELKSMAKGKEVQRELLLRGETSNAGRLVQLFEESQMFAQAAQRGADHQDPAGARARSSTSVRSSSTRPPPALAC